MTDAVHAEGGLIVLQLIKDDLTPAEQLLGLPQPEEMTGKSILVDA